MASRRVSEIIELGDSDDDVATSIPNTRPKAFRAGTKASRLSKAQPVDTIDLTGDDTSSRTGRLLSGKARGKSPTGLLARMQSIITPRAVRETEDAPATSKAVPRVIQSSDHEDEMPAESASVGLSGFRDARRGGHGSQNESLNSSRLPSPKKRSRDHSDDRSRSPNHSEKRRRVLDQGKNGRSSPSGVSRSAISANDSEINSLPAQNATEPGRARSRGIPSANSTSDIRELAGATRSKEDGTRSARFVYPVVLKDRYGAVRSSNETAQPKAPEHHGSRKGTDQPRNGSRPDERSTESSNSRTNPPPEKTIDGDHASGGASPSSQLHEEIQVVQQPEIDSKAQSPSEPVADFVKPQYTASAATGESMTPSFSSLPLPQQVERVVGKYMQEMRDDTDYFTKALLRRSRQSIEMYKQKSSPFRPANGKTGRKSVASEIFSRHRKAATLQKSALNSNGKSASQSVTFNVEVYKDKGKKPTKEQFKAKPKDSDTRSLIKDVPGYAHYVSLNSNILAPNTTTMTVWPYFGDDEPNPDEFEDYYYMDTKQRQRKIRRLLQAQKAQEYMESALQDLHLEWDDVLRFLLDPIPDVGSLPAAKIALRNKATHMEDFPNISKGKKWVTLLSTLAKSETENLAKAGILCDNFQRMAGFPLWHVARRCNTVQQALKAQESEPSSMESRTCRICLKFNCTQHGELREESRTCRTCLKSNCTQHVSQQEENNDSDSGAETDEAVATDILYPLKVNYRRRMEFPRSPPPSDEGGESVISLKQKKMPSYWEKGNYGKAGECGPFYPCHHPGLSCAKANCSCVVNKTPCEKSCGCSADCPRKFQGCSCSQIRNRKGADSVCMRDSSCACYQMGRECDADLCGACGVCEVLDPVNRQEDLKFKCHNASIQRGVPKHTLLGDSGVHGMGLYAGQSIRAHEFIGEYKGEVITRQEADRRGAVYEYQDNSYLFSLNTTQEVDSTLYGNKIRFINHRGRDRANVYPLIRLVNTVHRIGLFAADNIKIGEELFFDYGPKFPEKLLGGEQEAMVASTPYVRNSKQMERFYEVEDEEDEVGNRRARKAAASSNARGRSRKTDSAAKTASAADAQKPKKKMGGARPGAGRKPGKKKVLAAQEAQKAARAKAKESLASGVGRDHDQYIPSQDRLAAYNISQEDMVVGDDGEDDEDFVPDGGGEGASEAESSEEDEYGDDESDGYVRTRRGRGRPKRFDL